ncbi:hypothetical protein LTR70_001880 [Exophiala xenobiotica]|uniref:Mediator of RNA polymerase II transcription subunit 9 n=1 Tax=Lithohypha guttulata TaxID=1690604 RepID=A0ABR0K9X1_9EURO|nr:hypothetical protein LTR24_005118 [Lithohypha guttulata]KAK5326865.1 hypothetical protein LTR70_001880 [Exophiala xenobiotica]
MPALTPPQIKTQASTPNIANVPSPLVASDHALQSTESSSTYPDPSIFTFLPDLYILISRLGELKNAPQATVNGSAPGIQIQQGDAAHRDNNSGGIHNLTQTISRESHHSNRSGSGSSGENASIDVRDLPAHIYKIRQRIAEAKEYVSEIPDVDRSIEDQEAEMRELRVRCAGLRGRLGELGGIARDGNKCDTVIGGGSKK